MSNSGNRYKQMRRALEFTVKELGDVTTYNLPPEVETAIVKVYDRAALTLWKVAQKEN